MGMTYNILHLEDSRLDAELIEAMLNKNGITHTTTLVDNQSDFLSSFRKGQYDIVLCDYNLPGYDGLHALKDVRAADPDIPFIFISGSIGEDRAVETLTHGATDYILKDRLARLPSAIERAMRHREELREKQSTDEALHQQRNFLQMIIDTIPVFLMVKDREGTILLANRMSETLYGVSPDKIIGRSESELNPNDKGMQQKIAEEQALFTGTPAITIPDDRFVHPASGEVRHLQTVKVPLLDPDGKPYQILTVSSDITERKIIEDNLLRSERMHNIGALAGGIAHDLNNVLAPILLIVEVLRHRMTDEPTLRMLKMVEETAKRGSGLIKQILSFARGAETEFILFQPKHVIEETEKIIKQTFPKSVRIVIDLSKDLKTIMGDVTQMHQVLMNLCVNARDAMPSGGTLTITAENAAAGSVRGRTLPPKQDIDFVKICVTDTGIGIGRENLAKIFEPFFTTKEIGKGTGLGLSTVKTIVENHKGFFDVESTPGQGTTFMLYFPSSEQKRSAEQTTAAFETPLGHGETILVVDDESAMLELIKTALETSGYSVIPAADGSEAIVAYFQNKESIKAVITDLMMPVMDGAVLIRTLRKENPALKILGMSGTIGEKINEPAGNSLGIPILQKPFTVDQLLVEINRVLASGR